MKPVLGQSQVIIASTVCDCGVIVPFNSAFLCTYENCNVVESVIMLYRNIELLE